MHKLSILLLTISAFSAAAGQLLLKIGADGKDRVVEYVNTPLVFGLLLYSAGVVIWIYVLSREQLVNVYAFTALTFVLVYLGGAVLLHEQISKAAFAGILLILAGLYLIVNFNSQV